MHRLLIVADHPSLHLGFATVGDHIARGLQHTGRWLVDYIGLYSPAELPQEPPYRVYDADAEIEPENERPDRVAGLVSEVISDRRNGQPRRLLLSIGAAHDQRLLLDQLDASGLRERVQFVAYMPVDFAPLPPELASLLRRMDLLVPFTNFASRTVRTLCAGQDTPVVSEPIPHGVDTSVFQPPDAAERKDCRERFFGVDSESPLIAFFGRNSGHKHPELALHIFQMFARGQYVKCRVCRRVTPFDLDPIDGSGHAPSVCQRCASQNLDQGQVNEAARLYLHTELLSRAERARSGGWDLELLASRFDITKQVIFDRSLRIGEGVPVTELARRMGACDIHLLPFDRAGWELTVLETGACGVANIITDVAAPPEYAASFSELVPPTVGLFGRHGTRGIMDIGGAIEALLRLTLDRAHRSRLGQRGVDVARAHSWERVIQAWDSLLSGVGASQAAF